MIIIGSAMDAAPNRIACGIKAVLNVAEETPQIYYGSIHSVKIPLLDRPCEDLSLEPINANEQIIMAAHVLHALWEEASSLNMSVLVHCRNGLSRAPTVVAAWYMLHGPRLTAREALAIVRKMRAKELQEMQRSLPLVRCPHPSFVVQLYKIEENMRCCQEKEG